MTNRCTWCGDSPLYTQYHDEEWGVPVRDDATLFEFLLLEGAQAGLSWITVLNKRDNYREAFDSFNASKIAHYSDEQLNELLLNPGIIRNRLKVYAARKNARAFLAVQEELGSFADYIWRFVGGEPVQNHWASVDEVPVTTAASNALSKDLKRRGFTFVGPTIMYAFMQATGMVNDHTTDCFRHAQCMNMANAE